MVFVPDFFLNLNVVHLSFVKLDVEILLEVGDEGLVRDGVDV